MTLTAAVLVAVLMAAVAWSPYFSGNTPEVRIAPVVAGAPPPPVASSFSSSSSSEIIAPPDFQQDELGEIIRSILDEFAPALAREAAASPEE